MRSFNLWWLEKGTWTYIDDLSLSSIDSASLVTTETIYLYLPIATILVQLPSPLASSVLIPPNYFPHFHHCFPPIHLSQKRQFNHVKMDHIISLLKTPQCLSTEAIVIWPSCLHHLVIHHYWAEPLGQILCSKILILIMNIADGKGCKELIDRCETHTTSIQIYKVVTVYV